MLERIYNVDFGFWMWVYVCAYIDYSNVKT